METLKNVSNKVQTKYRLPPPERNACQHNPSTKKYEKVFTDKTKKKAHHCKTNKSDPSIWSESNIVFTKEKKNFRRIRHDRKRIIFLLKTIGTGNFWDLCVRVLLYEK